MFVAQFGSRSAPAFRPVWLGAIANQQARETPTAKVAWADDMPYGDFQPDGYGAERSPAANVNVELNGQVYGARQRTKAEWERELRRHVGLKDWLVGFRSTSCHAGPCQSPLNCCPVCGTVHDVGWYARRARLVSVDWVEEPDTGARYGRTPNEVSLNFESDTHWQRLQASRWAWGLPTTYGQRESGFCDAPAVTEMAWPCEWKSCCEPPYRWFRRVPADWRETYCVANWTARQWLPAHIGTEDDPGVTTLFVQGDTFPLSRLAFKNFTRLTVEVCSPSGESHQFTLSEEWVGEPQYALVDPRRGVEVRYCPLDDDACLANPGPGYDEVAEAGAPYPVAAQTSAVVGRLYPGLNVLRFWGFRLPGHIFHWAYDIVENFL